MHDGGPAQKCQQIEHVSNEQPGFGEGPALEINEGDARQGLDDASGCGEQPIRDHNARTDVSDGLRVLGASCPNHLKGGADPCAK